MVSGGSLFPLDCDNSAMELLYRSKALLNTLLDKSCEHGGRSLGGRESSSATHCLI